MTSQEEYIEEGGIFHGHVPLVCGTKLDMVICGMDNAVCGQVWEEFCMFTENVDRMLNRFNPASEVSRINASKSEDGMSPELSRIMRLCARYSDMSSGMFDVAYADGRLDFGGFAKGYVLRICREMLGKHGVKSAFVNFGDSSILGLGHHPYGDAWPVDVISPFTGKVLETVALADMAMSTSGNTPAYTGHIVNPKTGERITGGRTVVAVCPDPLDAEVLSTVALVDAEGAERMKNAMPGAGFSVFEF